MDFQPSILYFVFFLATTHELMAEVEIESTMNAPASLNLFHFRISFESSNQRTDPSLLMGISTLFPFPKLITFDNLFFPSAVNSAFVNTLVSAFMLMNLLFIFSAVAVLGVWGIEPHFKNHPPYIFLMPSLMQLF